MRKLNVSRLIVIVVLTVGCGSSATKSDIATTSTSVSTSTSTDTYVATDTSTSTSEASGPTEEEVVGSTDTSLPNTVIYSYRAGQTSVDFFCSRHDSFTAKTKTLNIDPAMFDSLKVIGGCVVDAINPTTVKCSITSNCTTVSTVCNNTNAGGQNFHSIWDKIICNEPTWP